MPHTPARRVFASVQALRALAAVLVLLFHNNGPIFGLDKYWGVQPLGQFMEIGRAGVEIFFVISGFVILYAHEHQIGSPGAIPAYLKKRFVRIYPIYWLVTLAILPLYFLVPGFGNGFETQPQVIATSFALYGLTAQNTILSVAWTLFHEVLFYTMFITMLVSRKLGFAVLTVWVAACVANLTLGLTTNYIFSPLNILFVLGMGVYLAQKHLRPVAPIALSLLGISLFFLAGCITLTHALSPGLTSLIYGLGASLTMLALLEMEKRQQIVIPQWLTFLGNASYSIYLVHFLALSILAKLFLKLGLKTLPIWLSFSLTALLALAAGILVHLFLEKPLLKLFSKKSDN